MDVHERKGCFEWSPMQLTQNMCLQRGERYLIGVGVEAGEEQGKRERSFSSRL